MKRFLLPIALLTALAGHAFSDQVVINSFKYLNSNENPVVLNPSEASDLLNVEIPPSGRSVKKRPGYGLYKTISTTATGIHGGYHFFNGSGNDIQIWGSSVSLKSVVNDASPTTIVSSATVNSTWDCTDTQGYAYCVDSNRDAFIKTDGLSLTQWSTSPLGTMIESTPDRIVVAGVSGSPNTLYVSQSNTFTNFTTGVNATDAFTEVIAAAGSRISHIQWGCGKLLWWKDQSFGYFDFDDQFSAQVKIVSNSIGTFDNTSAIDPGGNVWFRAQDGHTYQYDCSSLQKMTIDITPQIQQSGHRTANSWTQSTQADFTNGSFVPTTNLSVTDVPGSVVPRSYGTDEHGRDSGWSSGSANNIAIGVSSLSLSTNNLGTLTNPSFEASFSGNWVTNDVIDPQVTSAGSTCGTVSPQSGSFMGGIYATDTTSSVSFQAIDPNTSAVIKSVSITPAGCTWTQGTLTPTVPGQRVKFKFVVTVSTSDYYLSTSDSYIWGGPVTFYYNVAHGGGLAVWLFDNIQGGSSTITSGSFTSQKFNLNVASISWNFTDFAWTVNTSTPTFQLQTAPTAAGPWTTLTNSSATNSTYGGAYAQYTTTITIGSSDSALTAITNVAILGYSSGTYYSAVNNAPNFASWNTLGINDQYGGSNSIAYYTRASTNSFTVLSATPSWTAQARNSPITSSTGTYFQLRADFFPFHATEAEKLAINDFTFNWFEGAASDQAYMLYFDNAIWESVAYGPGVSSNTYVFRYDLINQGWTLYSFGAGGLLIYGNKLYFGSVGDGSVYQFGSGASDNGTAISAFWKSKDFTGVDPFLQNALSNIDVFAKKDTGSTLTSTYTVDTTTSTAYSISLSTSNAIVQSRKLLPSGKLGYVFNEKIGDNSNSSQWEVMGVRLGYTQLPYRSTP